MTLNIYLYKSKNKFRNRPDFEIENATQEMFQRLCNEVNTTKRFISVGIVIFEREKFRMAVLQ